MAWKKNPQAKLKVAVAFEFDAGVEANFYVLAANRLSHIKDKKMAKGSIQIVNSVYEPFQTKDYRGIYMQKDVKVGKQSVKVWTVVAAKGPIAVEVLYSNTEITKDEIIKLAIDMLNASTIKSVSKPK